MTYVFEIDDVRGDATTVDDTRAARAVHVRRLSSRSCCSRAGGAVLSASNPRSPSPRHRNTCSSRTSADSASAPSLSPDGRMVTFKRGGDSFLGARPDLRQAAPEWRVGTADDVSRPKVRTGVYAGRITNRVYGRGVRAWDTWTVPVLGGQPMRLLPNASGLTWIADHQVLFSEIKTGLHMGIVTATDSRADSREIYIQPDEHAMAHYSYVSPDRQSVLVVEMTGAHAFTQPCRLVPFDGSSAGRQVGPQGTCTFSGLVPGRTAGCTSPRSWEAARTSGARGFLTERRNRSPSARSRKKALRWRLTAGLS